MKSDTTTNATSSPESAGGLSPYDGPDSKAAQESGPAPVPVSRFRALAKDRATPMSGTCGPLFTASSPSAVLQRSLESRLRARMDANGSPEFALTWKTWDMPAGEPICALRASERRTGGKGFIGEQGACGWRTPQASDGEGGVKEIRPDRAWKYKLRDEAALAGWPTAMAGTKATETYNEAGNTDSGRKTVELCGWPTPEAEEARRGFQNRNNGKRGTQKSLTTVAVESLAAWPTARANDGTGPQECVGRTGGPSLKQVAGWATPKCADSRGDPYDPTENRRSELRKQMPSAQAGQDASRSNAETARPAGFRLNPRFSLWLMGYPAAWASCGERAMQSFQKQRRRL